jgi:alpha-tubulin suppressor-like RCC1 family protein
VHRNDASAGRAGRGWRAARLLAGPAVLALGLLGPAGALPASAGVHRDPVATPKWIHVSSGFDATCGIREGNTLWCWGNGANGELGAGSTAEEHLPQQILKPTAAWTSVSAGWGYACATRKDGTLWCWGLNQQGRLGIGNDVNVTRPHQVTTPAATGWASVSAGEEHTCGVRADGTLWCWGTGNGGQLGLGDGGAPHNLPQQVTSPATAGWASVSAGGADTCAVRGDATLWCWGFNGNGELGVGDTVSRNLPEQVTTPTVTGWASVSAGGGHTCAVRADAALWCWGSNFHGQLGIGSTGNHQLLPQQVTVPAVDGWTGVSAGLNHTCATRTHAVLCWGEGDSGQLGTGGTTDQTLPQRVSVPSRTGWSLLALGARSTFATHTGHALWCWGWNNHGQLGLGDTTNRNLPQQVTG